jgi:D-3-phosphoglycerate dehydrogenase / 2-oxoglutarate reductase
MDLLIAEPLEAEVLQWLDARHELFYAPRLARERRAFQESLASTRAVLIPPQIAIDSHMLEGAPNLQAIGRIVAGPENIDLSACARVGIEVVRSSDAAAPAEAEFMLGALLALLRPSPEDADRVAGRELGSCTVGLVGMTQTSRVLARLLQTIGSRIVGYDPSLHASDGQWSRWGVQPLGLRDLFENTDAVCVQMSYYNRYRGLLGERALPYCRQGQVLVSVSPLALFNEEVLADVLKSGRMAAAWLDSVGPGSLDPGQPLHDARGLLVTPRLAAYTREARLRSAWGVARRIDEILRTTPARTHGLRSGRPAVAPVTPGGAELGLMRPPEIQPAPHEEVTAPDTGGFGNTLFGNNTVFGDAFRNAETRPMDDNDLAVVLGGNPSGSGNSASPTKPFPATVSAPIMTPLTPSLRSAPQGQAPSSNEDVPDMLFRAAAVSPSGDLPAVAPVREST